MQSWVYMRCIPTLDRGSGILPLENGYLAQWVGCQPHLSNVNSSILRRKHGVNFRFLSQSPHSLSRCCDVAIAKDMSGHNLDLGHVVLVLLEGNWHTLTHM